MHELENVNGIGKTTLERIRAAGIDTVEKLASAKIEDLLAIKGIGKVSAGKYIEHANTLITKDKKEGLSTTTITIKDKNETLQKMEEINYLMPTAIKEINKNQTTEPIAKPIARKPKELSIIKTISSNKNVKKIDDKKEISEKTKKQKKAEIEKADLFGKKAAIEAFDTIEKKDLKKTGKGKRGVKLKKVSVPPKPLKPQRQGKKQKKSNVPSKALKTHKQDTKVQTRKEGQKGGKHPFFPENTSQKIRFLHHKIKTIEESLNKEDTNFSINDIDFIFEYISILNTDYRNWKHRRVINETEIRVSFYDPLVQKEVEIFDLMFECARVLWIAARAYIRLSEAYEDSKEDWESTIILMCESSKMYKAATYFSIASIHQRDKGISLSAEILELESEKIRALAQQKAAEKEENRKNYNLASNLFAGLSALSKRLYYLRKYDEREKNLLKAKYNYEIGRACHLKARALKKKPDEEQNNVNVIKIQQKANYYFFQAEEIWENMLKNDIDLSLEEKEDLNSKLSEVNKNIIKNEVEILEYEKVKKVQDPIPIIIVPENIAPIVPTSTYFMTRYSSKDTNVERYRKYNVKKLEERVTYSKKEDLLIKKVAILRTINVLEVLYDKNEIEVEKFIELMEKYSLKQEMIEHELENLDK